MAAIDGVLGGLRAGAAGQAERPVGPRAPGAAAGGGAGAVRPSGRGFAEVLEEAVAGVEGKQRVADDKAIALVSGQDVPIHEVMVAATEAELAVQMTTAVAAKAIAAYQEIWRMEV